MDVRLDEIPKDWHQLVFRFRRVDGIRDADIERSLGGYFEEIDPVFSVSPAANLSTANIDLVKQLRALVNNSSDWAAFKAAVNAL